MAKKYKYPPTPIRRQVRKSLRGPVRKYAIATGELLWAANFLHFQFHNLFKFSLGPGNPAAAEAMWQVLATDKGQRDLLGAAASYSMSVSIHLGAEIVWAVKQAHRLGEKRNDAVHSATVPHRGKKITMRPTPFGTTEARYERLAQIPDLPRGYRQITGDLIALGYFVNALFQELSAPGAAPWPKRPRLRSIPG